MKIYSRIILPVVVCTIMVYTSCQKAGVAPAPANTVLPTTTGSTSSANDAAVGGQIAANLANSLAGTYGGVNVNDGVDSVSLDGHQGPHHGHNPNSLCGFFTDSVVSFNSHSGDTIRSHTGGNLKFYFNCDHGRPDGYTAYDSLNTLGTAPQYAFQYTVKQYYTIKTLTDDHTLLDVDGDINGFVGLFYKNTSIKPNISRINFVLQDLKINLKEHGDIEQGTATFTSFGSNNAGSYSIKGSMVFLGDHKADIFINGKVYHIDLKTGKVTS